MICKISCMIALVFIIGNIYFMQGMNKIKQTDEFKKLLNENLLGIYNSIVEERKRIGMEGYSYGLLISILIIAYNYFFLKKKFTNIPMICIAIATTFIVQYFYYMLSPKQPLMVTHLETREQRDKWHQVYKAYQYRYHMGIFIGIVGVGVLASAFKC